MFDFAKHITTLNTALIVAFVAFSDKYLDTIEAPINVNVIMIPSFFVGSILLAGTGMFLYAFEANRPDASTRYKPSISVFFFLGTAYSAFSAGLVLMILLIYSAKIA